MASDGTLKFDTRIDAGGFQDGINSIGDIAQKGMKATCDILKGATVAISGIGTAAVKVGSDFEGAMSKVEAISGASGKELEKFMKHVTECEECREELSIQYLVTEGMQHLEKESTFDLQSQLEKKMEGARKKIRARKRVIWFMYFIETLAILAVILLTILVIIK